VTDPNGHTTTYTIDYDDRVTQAVDAYGNSRSTSYTPDDQVASQGNGDGGTISYTYGANNTALWGPQSLTGITTSTNVGVSFQYKNSGATAYLPSQFTDSAGTVTNYSYDGAGNLQTLNTTVGITTEQVTVDHNSDGTISSVTTANNATSNYHYNTGHQLTSVTPPLVKQRRSWHDDNHLRRV
jgi:YD repeat-containing protein